MEREYWAILEHLVPEPTRRVSRVHQLGLETPESKRKVSDFGVAIQRKQEEGKENTQKTQAHCPCRAVCPVQSSQQHSLSSRPSPPALRDDSLREAVSLLMSAAHQQL